MENTKQNIKCFMHTSDSKIGNMNFIKNIISINYFETEVSHIEEFKSSFNLIFFVVYNETDYLLKTYTKDKYQRIINSEFFFREKGVSIIPPVQNKNGEYHIIIDENYVGILYPFIDAKMLLKRSNKNMKLFGNILGKLHMHGKSYFTNYTVSQDLFKLQSSEECLCRLREIKNQIKYSFVKRAIDNKISVIEKNKQLFSSTKMPSNNCFVHGDFHQRNIMFSNDNYYLFDFENAHYGISELDLVRTVFFNLFQREV